MTVREALLEGTQYLREHSVEDPSFEAGLLLSWVIGKERGFVYTHPEAVLSHEAQEAYKCAVQRRGSHEPFAYIAGECEFLSLTFYVNPNVLIPRGDTELLAEACLAAMGKELGFFNQAIFRLPAKGSYSVLDIGTGSGCLAVSLAKYAPCRVDAADISRGALETACRNALKNGVQDKVSFIQGDIFDPSFLQDRTYDLVVSNPPYIPEKDLRDLMPSVRDYEPHAALSGGEDGLRFYRVLASKARSLLNPNGMMAVECGFDQAHHIRGLFENEGMETLILRDLSGISRVVAAKNTKKPCG